MTLDHTPRSAAQLLVGSSRNWSVFCKGLNTGHHKKALVSCSCSRLAVLHGAPRAHNLRINRNPVLMKQ